MAPTTGSTNAGNTSRAGLPTGSEQTLRERESGLHEELVEASTFRFGLYPRCLLQGQQLLTCLLGLQAVGNITDNHEQLPGRELVRCRSNRQEAAIFAFHPPLAVLHSPSAQALQCWSYSRLTFLWDQVPNMPGQQFFVRIAGELTAQLIDLHKVTVCIGHQQADARLLHQHLVPFLAL